MSNRNLAPPFTRENAKEMQRRATVSRLSRLARVKAARDEALRRERAIPESARREITLKQLDKLDLLINRSLEHDDADAFIRLSAAKERLWRLVQPTAGSFRPGRRARQEMPDAPIPQAIQAFSAPQQVVVNASCVTDLNNNSPITSSNPLQTEPKAL